MAVARPGPEAALVARIERGAEELACRLTRAWRTEIPDFATSPAESSHTESSLGQTATLARQAVELMSGALRGEAPQEHERQLLGRQAARQAEQGLPLGPLLAAYAICGRVVFDALRESAGPQEHASLFDAASNLLRANAWIADDLARAYHQELESDAPDSAQQAQQDWHRALVRDLLTGIVPALPSLLEESQLAEGAVVLAVGFAEEPAAQPPEPPVRPARGMRAVQEAVDRYFGRTVPMLLEADGGHVLVPHALMPAPQGPALDEIAARIAEIRPTARIAAASASSADAVAAAARSASEVLRLAGRLGRPAGAYRMDDVLLEYHLTRRDESAELLDGLLAPLAERPELLETVRVYLEENYDRRRAAARLSLHPNTVDNRLARTTELTGLDPATPRGVTLLMTALALRDLG